MAYPSPGFSPDSIREWAAARDLIVCEALALTVTDDQVQGPCSSVGRTTCKGSLFAYQLRIKRIPEPISNHIEGQYDHHYGQPGPDRRPG